MMPNLINTSKDTDLRTALVVALGLAIVVTVSAIATKGTGQQMAAAPLTISAQAPEMIRTSPAGSNVVVEVRGVGATTIR